MTMRRTRVLAITGAGISAESGVPTFRGKDGYWRNYDPQSLATPEAFARDPALIWEWYRERRAIVRSKQPNPAHDAIARLASAPVDFLLLTQNVDNLHARAEWQGARVTPHQMVQIHGDLFLTRCTRCDVRRVDRDEDESGVPACPACGSAMRPGVVWFGEHLAPQQIARVESFLAGGPCDAVLVVGTTAVFDYIVGWASVAADRSGQIIEVNPEETRLSSLAHRTVREPAALALPRIVDEIVSAVRP